MGFAVTALVLCERQNASLVVLFAEPDYIRTSLASVKQQGKCEARFRSYRMTLLELLRLIDSPSVEAFRCRFEVGNLAGRIRRCMPFRYTPLKYLPYSFDAIVSSCRCR